MSRSRFEASSSHSQAGGITILVSLMLLVFLTIAAIGMSRNSFREVVSSGTTRQGSMVRNLADSGIEWSVLWVDRVHNTTPIGTGIQIQSLMATLASGLLYGQPYDVATQALYTGMPSTPSDTVTVTDTNITSQGYSMAMTAMGKMATTDSSSDLSLGSGTNAAGGKRLQDPDLWAIRSDALLTYGATTFVHSKEAWISTPAQ